MSARHTVPSPADLLAERFGLLQIPDLRPRLETAAHLRVQLGHRLDAARPDLAARIRTLDDWHAEVLADFIADAHVVAEALEHPPPAGPAADTRVG